MVAGIAMVLAAAGGGAWAFLHKAEPAVHEESSGSGTNGKTPDVSNDPGKQTPVQPVVPVKPNESGDKHPTIVPNPTPHKPPVPIPVSVPASGIMTWSGTIDNPAQQMVDIYIPNQRATLGSVALQPAPQTAVPIAVTVTSGNAIVLNQPAVERNYSTFRIAVRGTGQQTVTLQWKELSPSAPKR